MAAEIKIRAERRAGELLADMDRHKSADGRPKKGETKEPLSTLSDLNITKKQSSQWQAIAGPA